MNVLMNGKLFNKYWTMALKYRVSSQQNVLQKSIMLFLFVKYQPQVNAPAIKHTRRKQVWHCVDLHFINFYLCSECFIAINKKFFKTSLWKCIIPSAAFPIMGLTN